MEPEEIRLREIDSARMLEYEWDVFQRQLSRGYADYISLVVETLEFTRDYYSGVDNTAKYERWLINESDKLSPNHINLHSYLICFLDGKTQDVKENSEKDRIRLKIIDGLLGYLDKRRVRNSQIMPSEIEQKLGDEFLKGLDKPVKPRIPK